MSESPAPAPAPADDYFEEELLAAWYLAASSHGQSASGASSQQQILCSLSQNVLNGSPAQHSQIVAGAAEPPSQPNYFVELLNAIEEHFKFNLYEGYKRDGIKEGPGRYTWADGHVTIGE